MNSWKISVITVCYNRGKTIEDAIKSILNQTYQNFEYIIIDGNSKDETVEIIKKYEPMFKGKLKWISEPDNGIYDAMNKGLRLVTGDLICLLNSDDWYEDDAFEIMNAHYAGEPLKVQYAMQRIFTNGAEEMCNMPHHNFLHKRMLAHQTCFITPLVYDIVGKFDEQYKSAADYDFMIRASLNNSVIFEPIYKPIVCFRSGGISESSTGWKEEASIKRKYGFITRKQYYAKVLIASVKSFIAEHNLLNSEL